MQNEIGLAIRLGRVAVGLSQWQLAAQIGSHPTTINLIENGKRTPDARLLKNVLRELDAHAPKASPLAALVLKETRRIAEAHVATG